VTRKPSAPRKVLKPAAKALEAAARPVEVVGQTLERAFDPLASALKRAALKRADKQARQFSEPSAAAAPAGPAAPAKGAMPVSPLAVRFPTMPPVAGVQMGTARAGFYKHERDDLLVMTFPDGASCAGVFTRHGVGSAPVDWCKRHLEMTKGEGVRALVVNAGCANSFTGRPGADAVRRVCSAAAKRFDCRQRDVMVASTGVIGVLLDDAKIVHRLPDIDHKLAEDGWAGAAGAIMTTDTFAKGAHAVADIDGVKVQISGICKGSGMIAPDMATMLAFVFTDAPIAAPALQRLIADGVVDSFNAVTIDGDTSTSDTLLAFATGAAAARGAPRIARAADPRLKGFTKALDAVLENLAEQVARDGEGARKLVEVVVEGAASTKSARRIALSIANSPLVKTAIAGEDANWGRVVMAVGKAGEPADRDRLSIWFNGIRVAHKGMRDPHYDEADVSAEMKQQVIRLKVSLGIGRGRDRVLTCDLTKEYVAINGDYRS
jgi:glutamate N-acetyltransferase/amino-acid N-acetyltransferase